MVSNRICRPALPHSATVSIRLADALWHESANLALTQAEIVSDERRPYSTLFSVNQIGFSTLTINDDGSGTQMSLRTSARRLKPTGSHGRVTQPH